MKKIRFKNDREVLEALLDNKKIGSDEWKETEYIHLGEKNLIIDNSNQLCTFNFSEKANQYYIWQPPKKYIGGE